MGRPRRARPTGCGLKKSPYVLPMPAGVQPGCQVPATFRQSSHHLLWPLHLTPGQRARGRGGGAGGPRGHCGSSWGTCGSARPCCLLPAALPGRLPARRVSRASGKTVPGSSSRQSLPRDRAVCPGVGGSALPCAALGRAWGAGTHCATPHYGGGAGQGPAGKPRETPPLHAWIPCAAPGFGRCLQEVLLGTRPAKLHPDGSTVLLESCLSCLPGGHPGVEPALLPQQPGLSPSSVYQCHRP